MPNPTQTFRALYPFHADEEDELELQAGDLVDVTVVHAGEWGIGTCRRTQKEGSFPWSYVEPLKVTQQQHKLVNTRLNLPGYCHHCMDFIWGGVGQQASICKDCNFVCHKTCTYFVENNSALECTPAAKFPAVNVGNDPSKWALADVKLWLRAVKLEQYDPMFTANNIDGRALSGLNPSTLQRVGVTDPEHVAMFLACAQELTKGESEMMQGDFSARCRESKTVKNSVKDLDLPHANASDKHAQVVKNHRFKPRSYLSNNYCDSCRKHLWGSSRQGLQCAECGYNTHKGCLDVVPNCKPDCVVRKQNTQPGNAGIFGEYLDGVKAPRVITQLIKAVETRGITTPGLYKTIASVQKCGELRAQLLTSIEDTIFLAKDPVTIAQVLKQYFMELPEPLIPTALYDQFVGTCTLPEAEQISTLDSLIQQLPPANVDSMEALFRHLGVVASADNGVDAMALSSVWATAILRPSDEQFEKGVNNEVKHTAVLNKIITKCKCGGASGSDAPPILPRRMSKPSNVGRKDMHTPSEYENIAIGERPPKPDALTRPPKPAVKPRAASVSAADLTSYPWFGGEMSRPVADQSLQHLVDGAFLVRVSKTHGGYSLSVKFREIRHVVIVCSKGKFGFSEPTTFSSLPDLISHFQKVSLACYNAELETKLSYPYKTAPSANSQLEVDTQYDDVEEDVYISNVSALREDLEKQQRIDYRHNHSTRVKQLQRDLKAQEEILNMLQEQKKLHESFHESLQESDRLAVLDNYELLKARVTEAERSYQSLELALRTEQEKERAAGGQSMKYPFGGPKVPDPKTSKFYIGTTPRDAAVKMLDGKSDGTFLVRHSNRPTDPYTLSLRYGGETKHIQIKYDGIRFGLADPLAFFSLEALCDYYMTEKLSKEINTALTKPIKG